MATTNEHRRELSIIISRGCGAGSPCHRQVKETFSLQKCETKFHKQKKIVFSSYLRFNYGSKLDKFSHQQSVFVQRSGESISRSHFTVKWVILANRTFGETRRCSSSTDLSFFAACELNCAEEVCGGVQCSTSSEIVYQNRLPWLDLVAWEAATQQLVRTRNPNLPQWVHDSWIQGGHQISFMKFLVFFRDQQDFSGESLPLVFFNPKPKILNHKIYFFSAK